METRAAGRAAAQQRRRGPHSLGKLIEWKLDKFGELVFGDEKGNMSPLAGETN